MITLEIAGYEQTPGYEMLPNVFLWGQPNGLIRLNQVGSSIWAGGTSCLAARLVQMRQWIILTAYVACVADHVERRLCHFWGVYNGSNDRRFSIPRPAAAPASWGHLLPGGSPVATVLRADGSPAKRTTDFERRAICETCVDFMAPGCLAMRNCRTREPDPEKWLAAVAHPQGWCPRGRWGAAPPPGGVASTPRFVEIAGQRIAELI